MKAHFKTLKKSYHVSVYQDKDNCIGFRLADGFK